MAGARYCQVVVSASRKLKHEDARYERSRPKQGLLSKISFLKKSDVTNHTVKTARVHVEFKQM